MIDIFDFPCCYMALGEWPLSLIIQLVKLEPVAFPETSAPE